MATVSTSIVLEYGLANATTVKVQRYQFLHIQGGNGFTGGIRRLEGNLCHRGVLGWEMCLAGGIRR